MTEAGDASKKDFGKARYDLIPPEPLDALAVLYGIGARKYQDRGWEDGMKWGRVFAAMMRHAWAWWRGEMNDPIDGQHHLSSVAWCAFALMAYEMRDIGVDDRAVRTSPETGFAPLSWSLEQQTELEARVALVAGRALPTCPDLDQEYDIDHAPVVDGGRFDVV